ncbi:hypothetical protein FRB94_003259 [Tulasnella sp. JGI-2019a]|nr:hypothetical protein FRB93_003052 [Tulasnella sp. JGI-2019a]KAG9013189.1 hypothetical protein FRB94_003259 [Tulasnella sp. JGI-2019a]KAG9033001.1 hypothetical protein FRB95_000663 [Tulasnella sp. JGI-2019a]
MSQLPDETLRRILQQIQATAQQSSRALAISKAQIAQKERDKKMLQLTISELGAIPKGDGVGDVKMYKGVGKMFMQVPRKTVEKELKTEEKEISDEVSNLGKKSKYLEKQLAEAQSQLRDIFHHSDTKDS